MEYEILDDEDDFYSEKQLESSIDNDEIDSTEEGFMVGYMNS